MGEHLFLSGREVKPRTNPGYKGLTASVDSMTYISPSITLISSKILVGMKMEMSVAENRTGELWQQFMPHRHNIRFRLKEDFFSLQVYEPNYFQSFDPHKKFIKWAAVEVSEASTLPDGLESFDLEGGQYAVFQYRGMPGNPAIFQYIYSEWLPASKFLLDERPHFEVLGEKYKMNSPDSEEEIWIPVKEK